jgi:hypothetical protein
LLCEYLRWYPKGKKVIPHDLNAGSPDLLAQWYMGDGNYYRGVVTLFTNAYDEIDVVWLRDQIEKRTGIRGYIKHASRRRGRQPILSFSRSASQKFLEHTAPYACVPPFQRKFPHQ